MYVVLMRSGVVCNEHVAQGVRNCNLCLLRNVTVSVPTQKRLLHTLQSMWREFNFRLSHSSSGDM
jgi:hypothetical protein